MNIDEYRVLTRSIACRFCDAAPGERCMKPDLQRGLAECGEKFIPRSGGYLRICTVRGPHTVHAALPPHKVERIDYVHDNRSMDLHNAFIADLRAALAVGEKPKPETCGRCAWCMGDRTPRRRGYELTCPHGFGCCQNCGHCKGQGPPVTPEPAEPERCGHGLVHPHELCLGPSSAATSAERHADPNQATRERRERLVAEHVTTPAEPDEPDNEPGSTLQQDAWEQFQGQLGTPEPAKTEDKCITCGATVHVGEPDVFQNCDGEPYHGNCRAGA